MNVSFDNQFLKATPTISKSPSKNDPIVSLVAHKHLFIAGRQSGSIQVFEGKSGKLLNTLSHHTLPILNMSCNGNTLVSTCENSLVGWNLADGTTLFVSTPPLSWHLNHTLHCLQDETLYVVLPNKSHLSSCSIADQTLKVLEQAEVEINTNSQTYSKLYYNQKELILVDYATISIWDPSTLALKQISEDSLWTSNGLHYRAAHILSSYVNDSTVFTGYCGSVFSNKRFGNRTLVIEWDRASLERHKEYVFSQPSSAPNIKNVKPLDTVLITQTDSSLLFWCRKTQTILRTLPTETILTSLVIDTSIFLSLADGSLEKWKFE